MSGVAEMQRAVEALAPAEFDELADWLAEKREQAVDAAFERAILSGRFDDMAERALRDAGNGKCQPLDEFVDRS